MSGSRVRAWTRAPQHIVTAYPAMLAHLTIEPSGQARFNSHTLRMEMAQANSNDSVMTWTGFLQAAVSL